MPTELEPNELLIRCSCGVSVEHVVWIIHDRDDPEHECWYLMTSLDRRFGFWRRLFTGIKYAFRPGRLRYYGYAEVVLRNEDADAIAAFIAKQRALSANGHVY